MYVFFYIHINNRGLIYNEVCMLYWCSTSATICWGAHLELLTMLWELYKCHHMLRVLFGAHLSAICWVYKVPPVVTTTLQCRHFMYANKGNWNSWKLAIIKPFQPLLLLVFTWYFQMNNSDNKAKQYNLIYFHCFTANVY
jgi:hypothetical protein